MNMTLHYDAKQLTNGQKPAVYYYNTDRQSWVYLGGKINSDGTVSVETKHFDTYAVFGNEPVVFSDMDGHWGSSSIERLAGMNVIRGYDDSLFHPNAQVTRVQFASMLAKSMGLDTSNEVQKFTDASQIPTWAQADVAALVQAGFINGYSGIDGITFKPNQVITRAEMATMLGKVLKAPSISEPTPTSVNTFQDASSIPDWAGAEVNSLVESGIIQGYGDQTFRSNMHATRAEAATMLYKLLDALNI
ncbi:S-layer homology domain-containing protein [Paenibacillus macquariensis]|uniref:S-layer homology domain-containing protein n=2 Tax=Paenibacillus macquariensis TaxID=948756 RepID=A0ABY1JU87_9BACL|nr:S-layer homology domain-containing protein [Paenibacillus macquariensis]MEC0091003.1 S-layer homology domain-containing protein [Paenibacillus macquariensis]OAB34722.1 hypothetical protein PMSM_12800 [Paenibacillus macquariensis subsp. macquariensis]SIQ78876.1 S-layer homology domain-containing protein [Paenibacillus macquariensis]